MEKNYTYVVHYERRNPVSKCEYSILVYRENPIITVEDKESVKKLISKKHMFSKCTFIWYKLIEAPYNAEKNLPYPKNLQIPF